MLLRTSIIVKPETRRKLQLRKQENNLKNVDEVIQQALEMSGANLIKIKEGVKKK